jgi:hypothetical protein
MSTGLRRSLEVYAPLVKRDGYLNVDALLTYLDIPEEAFGWARELVKQGYMDEHIVDFSESGYGLQHPIRCRPNLIGCQFNEWLATQMAPDKKPGRYLMTWKKRGPHYARLRGGER